MRGKAAPTRTGSALRLGIRANIAQFTLLVGVNGLVGALVGQERALVPLLGERAFEVRSASEVLLFIVTFGLAKATANLAAGYFADKVGRKPVLIAGWLFGLPVPIMLMLAPNWAWVVVANVLLGVNQGLAWSTTVVMKIDLAGPRQRGLAMGLNEFAGYFAVALSAAASGLLASRYGLRPEPFFLGLAVVGLGLGLSAFAVKETVGHVALEAPGQTDRRFAQIAALTSFRDRGLAAASRTGLANNANDALVWGLLPLIMAGEGISTAQIGVVAGIYPAVWGLAQLLTGALSDKIGRRLPVAIGMWLQAIALAVFSVTHGFSARAGMAVLLGVGTALTYPALLAAVGDYADPSWRAAAVGVYRTWRDGGYVVGAIAAGVLADLFGSGVTAAVVAAITALSGMDAWLNLRSSSNDLKSVG